MKLKLNENGHVIVSDGKPVFVGDDGKDIAFDAVGTVATIKRLNGEAKGHREAKEAAEEALKRFAGIEDPDAARKAMETVKNFDAKKLIDAGEVEKVKAEAEKAFQERLKGVEEKFAPVVKERDRLNQALIAEVVGGSFARSKYIAEKLTLPADLVQAKFGSQFKVEDSKIVGYDASGNKIYSRSNPGEVASFDEALGMIVDSYAYRDSILKGSGGSGTGSPGAGGKPGDKTISRAAFDALSPVEQGAHVRGGGKVSN